MGPLPALSAPWLSQGQKELIKPWLLHRRNDETDEKETVLVALLCY